MNRILFVFALSILSLLYLSAQEPVINEVMTANASSVMDVSYYNFTEWVEIYNPSGQTRSLSGYYLSNDPAYPSKWKIPNISIPANGYAVIWFDKINGGTHANFRLRSNRELILLCNSNGTVIDSVRVEFPYRNHSYGRYPDGSTTWRYFQSPSHGKANKEGFVGWRAPVPSFSHPAGRYNVAFTLSLTPSDAAFTIRYTTDGSEPVETSELYGAPFAINKTTTVKARCFAAGSVASEVVVNTYFIKEHNFTLPVVSLSLDPIYLYDNTIGIYTDGTNGITGNCASSPMNWNRDWERYGHIEYFLADGSTRVVNTGAGVKIAGGCSRGSAQKSFGIYFRDKYGADNIRYPLFESKQADRFKSFMLRNSGNDFNRTMFQDAMMQALLIGEMDIDYNAYTPSVAYLNGQYWGIMNTREKITEGYFLSNYGLDEDSIDFLENERVLIAGSSADYTKLINYVNNNSLSFAAHYEWVKSRMDIEEYINYQIAQIYSANTDWPGNNIKYWKPKRAGAKWRWIIYDMDFGFGLYTGADHNTLEFATATGISGWPNPDWSTLLFRKLLQNDEFKNRFIDKFNVYIYSIYNPVRVNRIIDSLKNIISAEIPYHFNRWGGSVSNWNNNINVSRDFAAQRPAYMMNHLQSFFGLSSPHSLKISSNLHNPSFVSVNDVVIHDTLYEGSFFGGRTLKIKALSGKNYRFKQWTMRYSSTEHATFITANSSWKYLDTGIQPASTWKNSAFDDSGWKSGRGQLGYGEDDEATILDYGGNPDNKHITYYFRKKFTVVDPAGFNKMTINLLLDDGAVIYLNGKEVARYNMPAVTVTGSTLASSAIATENIYYALTISGISLLAGENLMAVELHQNSATSTDISFDLYVSASRLTGTSENTSVNPELSLTLSSDLSLVAEFERNDVISNLFINEICTKNTLFPDDEYEYEDWIEIYNAGSDTVNLSDLYFTNDLSNPTMFRISNKIPEITKVPPQSFKLLWADGESEEGLLHLDFKLEKDGGQVGVAHTSATGIYYIDSLEYPAQKTDYSYGRYADGTKRWFMLSGMTPGKSNVYNEITDTEDLSHTRLYPNPADQVLAVDFGEVLAEPATLVIYSVLGREMLRTEFEKGMSGGPLDISLLDEGFYLVRISNGLSIHTAKIMKKTIR